MADIRKKQQDKLEMQKLREEERKRELQRKREEVTKLYSRREYL